MRFAFAHPCEDILVQVVLDEAIGDEARRVREHLADCHTCRDRLQGVRALRQGFLCAVTEPPSDQALACILRRRASGERLILADGDMTPSATRGGYRRAATIIAVAAGVALAMFAAWRVPVRSGLSRMAPTVVTGQTDSLAVVREPPPQSTWASLAYAADAPAVGEVAYGPAKASRVDRVHPEARQYVRSVSGLGTEYLPTGSFVVDVSEAVFERSAVWRVVTTNPVTERGASYDTAWLRQRDLKLLYRRFHQYYDAEIITQASRGDTLLLQYDTIAGYAPNGDPSSRRSEIPVVLDPRYLLVTDQSQFLLLLRTLPLHQTWRGTVDINARSQSALFTDVPRHVNLRVDGDSIIHTFWGDVWCWRVLLDNGAEPERWYVSKESGDAVLVLRPASAAWPRSRLNLVSRSVPIASTMRGSSSAARP